MKELLQLAWDALLFKHESYVQHVARADALKRGLALLVLASKSFLPKAFLRLLYHIRFFERHPRPLLHLAFLCNIMKMAGIAVEMLLRGELSAFKFRQYAKVGKMLTQ